MGQGPQKWTQINQGQLEGSFGVHFRSPWPILGPLEGSKAISVAHFGPYFDLPWPPPANPVNFLVFFCKKGHFPQQIWLKTCIWSPKHILDLNPRASKWAVPCPKILLRRGVGPLKGLPFQLGILQSRVLFLYRASGAWPCWSGSDCFLEKC